MVYDLLKKPSCLKERVICNLTPLHLVVIKHTCLEVLLDYSDEEILNQRDIHGFSALELAVFLSGDRCENKTSRTKCHRCTCANYVSMLIHKDSAIPLGDNFDELLSHSSQRCRLRYIRAMKDRRERLKQFACKYLPPQEQERLKLHDAFVLKTTSPAILSKHYGRETFQCFLRSVYSSQPYHILPLRYPRGFTNLRMQLCSTRSYFATCDLHLPQPFFLEWQSWEYLQWLERRGYSILSWESSSCWVTSLKNNTKQIWEMVQPISIVHRIMLDVTATAFGPHLPSEQSIKRAQVDETGLLPYFQELEQIEV